jgi:hypothetical protein
VDTGAETEAEKIIRHSFRYLRIEGIEMYRELGIMNTFFLSFKYICAKYLIYWKNLMLRIIRPKESSQIAVVTGSKRVKWG